MAGDNDRRLVIIGGGIMGLGIGWRMAQAGWSVELFERRRVASGASWAAAGLLAARMQGGSQPRDPYSRFLRASQDMWPDLRDDLEAFTGQTIGYRTEGSLIASFSSEEAAQFQDMASWQPDDFSFLSQAEALGEEPSLASSIHGALLSRHDHDVDNRRFAQVLGDAFSKAGGMLHENSHVVGLMRENGRIEGIRLKDKVIEARHVLIAAGAWCNAIEGVGNIASVHPTKGQMLALAMNPERPLVRHALWGQGIYIVPRTSGRLVIGATTEEVGFDERVTARGMIQLLAAAHQSVPDIADLELVESWVGFRPTSDTHMPILGPTPIEGLSMATGHGHNGILMSAGTIELMARWLQGGKLDPVIQPFVPSSR